MLWGPFTQYAFGTDNNKNLTEVLNLTCCAETSVLLLSQYTRDRFSISSCPSGPHPQDGKRVESRKDGLIIMLPQTKKSFDWNRALNPGSHPTSIVVELNLFGFAVDSFTVPDPLYNSGVKSIVSIIGVLCRNSALCSYVKRSCLRALCFTHDNKCVT